MQRSQLEELIQSLARSRDENRRRSTSRPRSAWPFSRARMTGSDDPLVLTLKQADERLARYNQPRLEARPPRHRPRPGARHAPRAQVDVATLDGHAWTKPCAWSTSCRCSRSAEAHRRRHSTNASPAESRASHGTAARAANVGAGLARAQLKAPG